MNFVEYFAWGVFFFALGVVVVNALLEALVG